MEQLRSQGWEVVVVWEHELGAGMHETALLLVNLRKSRSLPS